MNQPDEDALWRSIVENYGDRAIIDATTGTDDKPPAPTEADAPARGQADLDRIVEPAESRYDEVPGAAGDRLDAWDDPDDHFVPPQAPPVPRPAPPQLLAWAGVFGVPGLALLLAVVHVAIPSRAGLLGLVWFVGGFGFLVATMRRDRDGDDWDDGAVL